ncbi:MAG: 2,3-bisphosphoglycerate-independent phosphoglycerate mutase [Candidatus Gottesmanbacteria bacterium]|nr:2,3-bisphosphoglycerate-independent phosphoglycerate mutase [Candidatus Gottesmanbacteria bacterium]
MVKPVVLIVLDGWGLAPPGPGNAISLAHLSAMPFLWHTYPHTQLAASGEAVGLPYGEDGNTETGHINIGAGRTVYQDLPRISMAVKDGSFFTNDALLAAVSHARTNHSAIHLMGVVSDGGVHASREHVYAILELIKKQQCESPVYIHVFTDGRDASPTSGERFVGELEDRIHALGVGQIATIIGRYFAMDRDRRWDRTERAYRALTEIDGGTIAVSATIAIRDSYARHVTDEFIEPVIIADTSGNPLPRIQDNDAVICFNFRIDRPRQLTRALVLPNFETVEPSTAFDPYAVKYYHRHVVLQDDRAHPFTRSVVRKNLFVVTMTQYEPNLPVSVAFPPQKVFAPLGSVFADHKIRQLRVSETEKERFVTYYFNGMREVAYEREDRLIIPSVNVPTYDLKPEMAALELTEHVLHRIVIGVYGFILINFANPDMVAHTGNIAASVKACEVTDSCLGSIVKAVMAQDGTCVITADHGNVEEMLGVGGEMDTEHSTFSVPFIMVHSSLQGYPQVLSTGKLGDIAPTILSHMHLPIPPEMTGKNLLQDFSL